MTPYYGRAQQQGLYDWYARVAQEFPSMPIIVYNVPVRAAVDIAPATVGRLRRDFENIVGIKETTKDFEHVSYVLDECGTDFIALSGIELLCYPMLTLGGRGHLSCVGNFAPRPVAELYDAFVAGDHERARALHYDLHPLVDAAFAEVNPVPAKWIMRELGLIGSAFAREPLAPLGDAARRRVVELLARSPHVTLPPRPRAGPGGRPLRARPARRGSSAPCRACARGRPPRSSPPAPRGDQRRSGAGARRRTRPPVGDLDEHRAPDRVEPAGDVAERVDERRVGAVLVDEPVELLVEPPEAERVELARSPPPSRR